MESYLTPKLHKDADFLQAGIFRRAFSEYLIKSLNLTY